MINTADELNIWFVVWCLAGALDNFVIGLTNVPPTVVAPTLWNYTVCGQYPGSVPLGATVSLQCSTNRASGRYIVLQRTGGIVVCELQVYECCSCY